jgi:WS/DGAT/MGAT family acyltransferase
LPAARLSALDASFLQVETPSAHMHVGWAAAFRPPDDDQRPTYRQLRDHVAGRVGRARRYRQRLAGVPLGLHDPVWVDDPAFDLDNHVRRAFCRDLGALADQVMSEPLPRDRPLWELWIAERLEDGRVGVVGKAHHAMVDGLAALELAALLVDTVPDPPPPEHHDWRPDQPPTGIRLLADAVVDRAHDALDVVSAPVGLMRHPKRAGAVAAEGLRTVRALGDWARAAAPRTGLNPPISPARHLARLRRPLADLREIRRRHGATVNDVVLAASAGGMRQYLELRGDFPVPLKTMIPVNVRDRRSSRGELGNRIAFVFVDLPCDEADPCRRLRDVQFQVGAHKAAGDPEGSSRLMSAIAYAPRLARSAVARLVASPRTFNLTVSNIPGPRDTLYMLGCELEEVFPVVPIADQHALSIGVTTIREDAFFGIYADSASLPDADLLAECLDEAIDELLAAPA